MILVTGAKGTIGRVLVEGLQVPLRPFDLPEFDAHNFDQLKEQMQGCEAVIHLAWNIKTDNFDTHYADPQNFAMTQNIFKAALESGVKRVILASSIHADMPKDLHKTKKRAHSPYYLPHPDSPYGANKVAMEAMGRYFAEFKGLQVICIRFGWVGAELDYSKPRPVGEGWLSHRDCISLVTTCLETHRHLPDNYAIIYGLSHRIGGVHDLINPFGWEPEDSYKIPTE